MVDGVPVAGPRSMSASRRPTASVMTLQIVSLVILSALAAMMVWRAADTRRAKVALPRHAIKEVRAASTTAMVAPYAYLQSRDPRHLNDLTVAVADARANVETLRTVLRNSGPSVDAALDALNQLEANAGQVYNAQANADLTGALEEMELARSALDKHALLLRHMSSKRNGELEQHTGSEILWCTQMQLRELQFEQTTLRQQSEQQANVIAAAIAAASSKHAEHEEDVRVLSTKLRQLLDERRGLEAVVESQGADLKLMAAEMVKLVR